MSYICHVCQFLHVHISDNYVSIYTSYELTAINNMTRRISIYTSHYWHMPLKKYACPITHVCQTAPIIQSTCRPQRTTNVSHKTSTNCSFIYHAVTINVPATNMSLKYYKYAEYANCFKCIYQTTMSVYIYLIQTHPNQQCDQEHWYTYISH